MPYIKAEDVKHPNFISNGRVFIVRCPQCRQENYAPAVASGVCAMCGVKYELVPGSDITK